MTLSTLYFGNNGTIDYSIVRSCRIFRINSTIEDKGAALCLFVAVLIVPATAWSSNSNSAPQGPVNY